MYVVNTIAWLGYLALPWYFRKLWKPLVSSSPLRHFTIMKRVSYDLRKQFLFCIWLQKWPQIIPLCVSRPLCRTWYKDLASISSPYEWSGFAHKMGQKCQYGNFDSRALKLPFCLRTHHKNKLEDEGPPGPDPSHPSHPRCSLRHERPAMISRASHPSTSYLQMPEEPGWTRKRVCLSPHQTVSHTGVTEINGCCSKALSLGVVCCTTEGDWYIYSVNNYKR